MLQITDCLGSYPTDTPSFFKELVSGYSVTASLVADEYGNTVSNLGNSSGLGNGTDLSLLIALRRKSQVILTTGKTFRSDQYKFPKVSDLAVLTEQVLDISVPARQKLIVASGGYRQALLDLQRSEYTRVHIEYGITGVRALLEAKTLDALFLSSRSKTGLLALASELNVEPLVITLEDLYVGLVAWQPSGNQLAR